MGWWGHKSNENDACGDMMDEVLRKGATSVLGRLDKIKSYNEWDDAIYVGIVREVVGVGLTREHVQKAIVRAKNLLKNKEHIDSFDNPRSRRANLVAEIKMFNKFLDEQKGKA